MSFVKYSWLINVNLAWYTPFWSSGECYWTEGTAEHKEKIFKFLILLKAFFTKNLESMNTCAYNNTNY